MDGMVYLQFVNERLPREETMTKTIRPNSTSHIPEKSFLFEKIVPASLIIFGIITLGLILFAAGVLFGIVKF